MRSLLLASTALVLPLAAAAQGVPPNARPVLDQVVAGGITIQQNAARTQVNQAEQRGIVDWRSFDVGSGHAVRFQQPDSRAVTLNRVTGPDPSVIAGRISANGQLVLVNQSGVVFTQGAQVDAAGLVVSAPGITNRNFMAGRMVFDQPPRPNARVENQGRITVREAGLAALVAPQVANRGTITARLGRVALAGAEAHTVDLYGDGMLAVEVTGRVTRAPDGGEALVTNTGVIAARGGTVQLTAQAVDGIVQDLVRVGGRVAADTDAATGRTGRVLVAGTGGAVRIAGQVQAAGRAPGTRGGTVEMLGDRVLVEGTGRVNASGAAGGGSIALGTTAAGATRAARAGTARGAVLRADAGTSGTGGTVRLNSTAYTEHAGRISARGGRQGGDGGFVEVSGQRGLRVPGRIDASAPAGRQGTILFDPTDIEITDRGTTPLPPSGVLGPEEPPDTASLSAFQIANFSGDVVLGATRDIFVRTSIFGGSSVGSLSMTAGRDLQVDGSIGNFQGLALTAQTGELRLNAGLFNNGTTTLTAGGRVVVADTAGTIAASSLTVSAGGDVILGASGGSGSAFASIVLSGGPSRIGAGGDVLVQTALNGGSSAPELILTGGGNVRVNAAIGNFSRVSLNAGTDAATLAPVPGATGAVTLAAPVTASNSISLQAGTGGITQSAALSTTFLSVATTGSADLGLLSEGTPANRVDRLGQASVTGDFSLAARGFRNETNSLSLDGQHRIGGRFTVRSAGSVGQSQFSEGPPNSITAGTMAVLTPAGNASLLGQNGIAAFSFTGGALTLRNGRDMRILGPGVSASGQVDMAIANGGLSIDSAVTGQAIRVVAAGAVQVNAPVQGFAVAIDAGTDMTVASTVRGDFSAVTLRAGRSLTVTATGAVSAGSAAPVTLLSGVDFASEGVVDPTRPGELRLSGPVSVDPSATIFLGAGRDGILQDGGSLRGGRVVIGNSGGDALLGQAGNAVAAFGPATVTGRLLLDNGTADLALQGAIAAQSIALRTAGAITVQRSASLTAPRPGGTIGFASGGLVVEAGATITAGTVEIAPFAAAPLSVASLPGAIAADTLRLGAVTFPDRGPDPVTSASAVTLAGPIGFAGTLDLRSLGTIDQASGASLAVGVLTARAGGAIVLEDPGNTIGTVRDIASGGGLRLRAATLALAGHVDATGQAVTLTAGSGGIAAQPGGFVTAASLALSSDAGIDLQGANAVDRLGPVTAQGDVAFRTLRDLTLDGAISTGVEASLTLLVAGGLAQTAAGGISTGLLTGSAAGPVDLTAAENAFSRLGAFSVTGGDFALRVAGALEITDHLEAGGQAVTLLAPFGIAETGAGRITAALLTLDAGDGSVVLEGPNAVAALGTVGAAGLFSLVTGGDLALQGEVFVSGGEVPAGEVRLAAGGAITQAATSAIQAATLSVTAGGSVALTGGNSVTELLAGSASGSFALSTLDDLTIGGPLAVPGGSVRLAVAGRLGQTAEGVITAASLGGSAGHGALLDDAPNRLGGLGGFDAGSGDLRLLTLAPQVTVPQGATVQAGGGLEITAARGSLTVDGTVSGAATALRAATALAVTGFSAIARDGDLLLAANQVAVAGLIQAAGGITVQAARQASLSGRAVAGAAGLTVAAPLVGFGGLDAHGAPVTLALGTGGIATGALDAGALTVQGGAGATLTGSIAGVADDGAAALGRRATASGVPLAEPLPNATAFTFNACPIGVAVCHALPPPVPPPAPPLPPPTPPEPPRVVTLGPVLVPLTQNPEAVMAGLEPANLIPDAARLRSRPVLPEMRIARDRSEEEELAPPDVRRDDY